MVLGVSSHAANGGYPQPGYAHKEEYSKQDYYKDGHMHKEDYYKADNYGNSSSMQMMRPHPSMHSQSFPSHGNGGYSNTNDHGYGISHSSHMGLSRPQEMNYGYQSGHNSNNPYYQQQPNGSHGWISKDLDD